MFCRPMHVKAFLFIFDKTHFLRKFTYHLLFLLLLVYGCTGNKEENKTKEHLSASQRVLKPVNFDSLGIKNLVGSNNPQDIICQTWEFREDIADNADADAASNIERVYRGVCFFKDGSMIKNPRGNMLTGRWELDRRTKPMSIHFILDNGEKENYIVNYLSSTQMQLAAVKNGKRYSAALSADGMPYIDPLHDPFYLPNNLWRIKPASHETDVQIRKRLKDCIHFFVLFYEQKIKTESENISFVGLPSCFRWYAGGIYLQKENNIQQKWIDTYNNWDDAMKAYKLADKLLDYKYQWPKKENNWLKQNLSVLKQMEARLDSL